MRSFLYLSAMVGVLLAGCGDDAGDGTGGGGSATGGSSNGGAAGGAGGAGAISDFDSATMKQIAADASARAAETYSGCQLVFIQAVGLEQDGTVALDGPNGGYWWAVVFECEQDRVAYSYVETTEPIVDVLPPQTIGGFDLAAIPDSPVITQAHADDGCGSLSDGTSMAVTIDPLFPSQVLVIITTDLSSWQGTFDANGLVLANTPCGT